MALPEALFGYRFKENADVHDVLLLAIGNWPLAIGKKPKAKGQKPEADYL
jgi:hypothetical protein